MKKYKIDDVINIYKKLGLIGLRDYLDRNGLQVYNAKTLKELNIMLIDTLINLESYHLCNGSTYSELNEVIKKYEKK